MDYQDVITRETAPMMTELYCISTDNESFYYCTGSEEVQFRGEIWRPAAINRSAFSVDDQLGNYTVTLNAPISDVFARYLAGNPIQQARLAIYRIFEADAFQPVFVGKIKGSVQFDPDKKVISAQFMAGSMILGRIVPSIVYSAYCNNVLFDARCGVKRDTYKVSITVTGAAGREVTAAAIAGYPANYFVRGVIEFDGYRRSITEQNGSVVTLRLPFGADFKAGVNAALYPGCDKAPGTCRDKFKNLRPAGNRGFLGMPSIPDRNPVVYGFR